MCSIATSFLFPSPFPFYVFLPPLLLRIDVCSVRSLSHLPFHIHSASLVNPFSYSSPYFSLLHFIPPPPRATLFTVADIFRVWRAVKSLWRSMCTGWLSALSHSMMEWLAYLWHGSSCFCHMFDVLRALGIRPIFHRWAGCWKTSPHPVSPYDLAVRGAIEPYTQQKHRGKYTLGHIFIALHACG